MAAGRPLDDLLKTVCALIVEALPVDRCDVLVQNAELPRPGALRFPLVAHRETVGVLSLSREDRSVHLTPGQLAQLDGVRAVLALAVRASGTDAAISAERGRIAQDLHDSVGQLITGIGLRLADHLADVADATWRGRLQDLLDLIDRADGELRQSIDGLLFRESDEDRLEAAILDLCRTAERTAGMRVTFTVRGNVARLGAESEDALFRVAHEALLNAEHHARASTVDVQLSYDADSVSLTVQDDGVGMKMHDAVHQPGRYGIRTMRRRIEDAGGTFHVGSTAPGGVVVKAVMPGKKVTAYAAGAGGGHR